MHRHAVIMAGGSGTRLWPLSRRRRPKQLLRIIEGRSLLRMAYERLAVLLPPERIHVITLAEHLPAVAAELPELPAVNLIGEPVGRDTANAVALSAGILHARDPATIMGVFTADHVIRPVEQFAEIVRLGYETAERQPDALITFGILPTEPHTGMGYVHRGEPVAPGVYRVQRFREKPNLEAAKSYVASGDYYWNSGMFVWPTATILEQLRANLPETHDVALRLGAAWGTPAGRAPAENVYGGLKKISIDFAVMEKAPRVLVVEMALQWSDVGSWTALAGVLGADATGNVRSAAHTAALDAHNNVFVTEDDHLIAAIGVEGLVVVHSPDATLVCRREDAQRIKDLVERLSAEGGERYQ